MYEDSKTSNDEIKIIKVKKLNIDEISSRIQVADFKEVIIQKKIFTAKNIEFFVDDGGNVLYAEALHDIFYINEENVFNYVSLQDDITFIHCFLKNQTIVLKGEKKIYCIRINNL